MMNLPEGHFLQKEKYQLSRVIGQGGFGITYLGVWNTELKGELGAMKTNVPVCIKEYFFKDYCYRDQDSFEVKVHSHTGEKLFDKFKEKLIREAKILSAVQHPFIVNVLEVFEENNTAYIVMEYIKGCSLKYLLDKEGVLAENKALKYIHQIGNALDFVHEKNIVHLDIKPSNILIDKNDHARLIDFGVSKRYDIEEKETSTTTLTLSKGFASIEQYDEEGTQTFSPCPDIYSLGATLYNLLTSVIPTESILRATKPMLPPSAYNSNITPKTEKAILKAMEIKPEDRYETIKEMLATLDIPPYEFEENNLEEESELNEEENTEVIRLSGKNEKEEDEITLITKLNSEPEGELKPRKRKKRFLVAVIFLFGALIGYVVYGLLTDEPADPLGLIAGIKHLKNESWINKPISADTTVVNIPDDKPDETIQTPSDSTEIQLPPQTTPDSAEQKPDVIDPKQTKPAQTGVKNGTSTPTVPNTTNINEPKDNQSSIQSKKEGQGVEYQKFLESARIKMKKEPPDIEGALNDLSEAGIIAKELDIKSDLIEELRKSVYEGESEWKKKERETKYVGLFPFGKLFLVCDTNTKKWGAIDVNNVIIIPIEYATVDRDERTNVRRFVREDGTVVLYNDQGIKIDN